MRHLKMNVPKTKTLFEYFHTLIISHIVMRFVMKIAEFKKGKEEAGKSGGSFDTDEFFDLALKRSYKNLGTKK